MRESFNSRIISNCYVFFPGLSLASKTGVISIVNIGGMILNLALNFFMIPRYGIAGAANATMISAMITFIAHFTLSQKYYLLPIGMVRLILMLRAILLSVYGFRVVA